MDGLAELRSEQRHLVVPSAVGARLLGLALDRTAPPTWEPPEILAWSNWVARHFEALQLQGQAGSGETEFLLAPAQETVLWQRALSDDGAPEQAAPLAREAWRIAHEWGLPWRASAASAEAEDVYAFRRWAAAYVASTEALRASDEARFAAALPAAAAQAVRLLGFIDPSPALRALSASAHASPPTAPLTAFDGRAFADRADELGTALDWATALVEADEGARVVIALDSLQQEQELLRRCLRERFSRAAATAAHVSVREALARVPSMQSLLAILELTAVPQWDALSAFITSRHVAGADVESAVRARFDAALREQARFELPLAHVQQVLARTDTPCPLLGTQLAALQELLARAPRRQSLNGWLGHFERCLQACGWPGPVASDGERRRALGGWSELRDRLQRLDAVLPPVPLFDARNRLRQALAETSAPVPAAESGIFIVTPEEACLLAPTHLWLAGAEANALGARMRPSPLLPFAAQRAAGVPGSDASRDLLRTRRLLGLLAAGRGQRVASYCAGDGDQVYSPNPLIPALRSATASPVVAALPSAWRQAGGVAQIVVDDRGPALPDAQRLAGGVSVLAAQAACPFRAFARHRLQAAAVAEPLPGLDRRTKGTLVHRVLAFVWSQLNDQATLLSTDGAALQRLIGLSIARAERLPPYSTPLERELSELERARVARLLTTWMAFEAARPPFTVHAAEAAASVTFDGLALNIRIDRIERDADGCETIVDYKTGACRESAWHGPRIDEPQLPFYALTSESSRLAAIAFARVDIAEPKWISLPRADSEAATDNWHSAIETWRIDIAALVAEIRAGEARLAPKRGASTCRLCEMQLLCRVAESKTLVTPDDAEDEATGDVD